MSPSSDALSKSIWSDKDYEEMQWHDVFVHGLATIPEQYEFLLDLDYMLQWIKSDPPDNTYAFWIAPATLVFYNVIHLEIHLDPDSSEIILGGIHRLDQKPTPNGRMTSWQWIIETTRGSIRFRATSFAQYLRSQPVLTRSQALSYDERGGISFDCPPTGNPA